MQTKYAKLLYTMRANGSENNIQEPNDPDNTKLYTEQKALSGGHTDQRSTKNSKINWSNNTLPCYARQYSISAVAAYIFPTFLTSLSLFNQLMHRVDNTVEGKSSVFYLIRMRWMPPARGCR